MVISIHQPCYIPYLGIFYKIWKSDKFVFLDDAQYSNGYVFSWNRIKTPQGETRLHVPLEKKFGAKLTEVRPKYYLGWVEKHLKTVQMNYARSSHFSEVFEDYKDCITKKYESLAELNIAAMLIFMEKLGIKPEVFKSSNMNIQSKSESRVIEIIKRVGGNDYISGVGGKNYQDEKNFKTAEINLIYSDFKAIEYKQLWGQFRPNLSILDYCMNEGYENIEDFFRRSSERNSDERI